MRPTVRQRLIRTGVALTGLLLAMGTNGPIPAEGVPLSYNLTQAKSPTLQNRMRQLTEMEAALQRELKEETQLASRPDSDYLLYQGSIHLFELDARLAQTRAEMKLIKSWVPLQEEASRSADLLRGQTQNVTRGYPPYSGTPLLSFNDATQSVPETLPFSSFGIVCIRLFLIGALILTVVVPAMAIAKGTVDLRRKGTAWIRSCYTRLEKRLGGEPPGEAVRRSMHGWPHGTVHKAA